MRSIHCFGSPGKISEMRKLGFENVAMVTFFAIKVAYVRIYKPGKAILQFAKQNHMLRKKKALKNLQISYNTNICFCILANVFKLLHLY